MGLSISNGNLSHFLQEENIVFLSRNYTRIFEKQKKNPSKSMDPKVLIEIVKKAYDSLILRDRKITNRGIDPELPGEKIVISFHGDKIHLHDLSNPIQIGSGGNATVHKVNRVGSKKMKAFKMQKPSGSIFGEAAIIQKLHEDSPYIFKGKSRVPGIQKPFYEIRDYGSSQHLYGDNLETTLQNNSFPTLNEKIEAFYNIILGFEYCVRKKGLLHKDIKLENIFYEKDDESAKGKLFLGDFGTAILACPMNPQNVNDKIGCTVGYMTQKDQKIRLELNQKFTKGEWIKYIELCKQMDVFALGCVFAKLLVPTKEIKEPDKSGYADPSSFNFNILKEENIPEEVITLVKSMLDPEPEKRPSMIQVLSEYEKIMKQLNLRE